MPVGDATKSGDFGPDPAMKSIGMRQAIPAISSKVVPETPRNAAWAEPVMFDKRGNSNQLIVRINPASAALTTQLRVSAPGSTFLQRSDVERAFIDTVDTGRDAAVSSALGAAKAARYLIASDRISDQSRSTEPPDSALERLHQFIVLRYASVDAALAAAKQLPTSGWVEHVENDAAMHDSAIAIPTNTRYVYPGPYGPVANYQWGMHAMNFAGAWQRTTGHGYVGIVDGAIWGVTTSNAFDFSAMLNPDLIFNLRRQFAAVNSANTISQLGAERGLAHGSHVAGIAAGWATSSFQYADAPYTYGTAGGCPNCAMIFGGLSSAGPSGDPQSARAELTHSIVARGAQVINISANDIQAALCPSSGAMATAIATAISADVVFVNSSGNDNLPSEAQFPANCPEVLAVAGAMNTYSPSPGNWARWIGSESIASSAALGAGAYGVIAPAKSVLSTFNSSGVTYFAGPPSFCGSASGADESTYDPYFTDRYGTCTGTSMAAPHVTALAGILRSASPLKTQSEIKGFIRSSSSLSGSPNALYGYGMPDAGAALEATIPSYNPQNRLTPLFSYYSNARKDWFYTSVPQMARAALMGTLQPVQAQSGGWPGPLGVAYAAFGTVVNSYPTIPSQPYASGKAEVWVFTTSENPKDASTPLVPLFRLSYACNHPQYSNASAQAICNANPDHTDTTYTTSTSGVSMFTSWGYRLFHFQINNVIIRAP